MRFCVSDIPYNMEVGIYVQIESHEELLGILEDLGSESEIRVEIPVDKVEKFAQELLNMASVVRSHQRADPYKLDDTMPAEPEKKP